MQLTTNLLGSKATRIQAEYLQFPSGKPRGIIRYSMQTRIRFLRRRKITRAFRMISGRNRMYRLHEGRGENILLGE